MDKNVMTKKKAFLLMACIWFIISFSVIQTTYAKYITNLDANANIAISYWNISVNDQNILESSDFSSLISPTIQRTDYSKADVIVPGGIGYFDLNIDSSKVSIPFTITVSSSINEASTLTSDFIVSGYSLDNGATITDLADGVFSFSCDIAGNVDSTVIRVYTTWTDDGLDSKEDTALGISVGTAILDVNLKFEQII